MKLYGMQDVGTIDYTASTTKKLALPRNRFLQAVYLYVKITGDTAGSVTADEEKAAALIKRVRIEAGQADNPLDLKGIDLWRFNKYNQGVVPRNSLSTTVSQSNITLGEYQAKMAFALSQNPLEATHLLPAHMLSSLDIVVDWGAAADLGTGYTVDSVDAKVVVKEVDLTAEDLARLTSRGGLRGVYLTDREKNVDATYAAFGLKTDLPVGRTITRMLLTVIDNSVRNATLVTDYKVRREKPPKEDLWGPNPWDTGLVRDVYEQGLDEGDLDTGVSFLDFLTLGGLSGVGLKPGELQLQSTNGSPTATATVRVATQETD